MELVAPRGDFASYVAARLQRENFVLLDIGCSGGIDQCWRQFGERLEAHAFDPNLDEIDRLRAAEKNPLVRYVGGFVGVSPDDPIRTRRGNRGPFARNPWERLAVARSVSTISKAKETNNEEKRDLNIWQEARLADSGKPIDLRTYLRSSAVRAVDFIKIDIDGEDFDVLQSLESILDEAGVIGCGLEVNYFGSDHPSDHVFHNTDRFMRKAGFDLFGLTVRTYSNAALPGRYLYVVPAQGQSGRPLQGDALYLRDPAADDSELSQDKLLKLAALFSLAALPDCAVEILLRYRDILRHAVEIDEAIGLLVRQSGIAPDGANYEQIIREFEANGSRFYPGWSGDKDK
jgi:FkbM family methyltransferase